MSMRILHVTEAMGAGIVTLLDSISRRQADEGATVRVLFLERPDTPSDEELGERFDHRVELVRLARGGRRRDLLALFKELRRVCASSAVDVIHLHSSFAGAVGRVAARSTRSKTPVFYSPHGFAFLRMNASPTSRKLTRWVERVLARREPLILTSPSELAVAESELRPARAYLLQTGVPSETVRARSRSSEKRATDRPVVGMVGRITYQKAPWRFAAVARELGDRAEFQWIGSGSSEDEQKWLGGSPVSVTGWLSAQELAELMDRMDILLFPSLWEGMSLSLIQAQAQGIPAVVSDVVGNRDSVEDEVTGFVCASDSELLARTAQLLDDPSLRERMSHASLEWALRALTDDNIGLDSMEIYAADRIEER